MVEYYENGSCATPQSTISTWGPPTTVHYVLVMLV